MFPILIASNTQNFFEDLTVRSDFRKAELSSCSSKNPSFCEAQNAAGKPRVANALAEREREVALISNFIMNCASDQKGK